MPNPSVTLIEALRGWVARGTGDAALQGACVGLVAGGFMGLDAAGHVASAIAAGTAAVAIRLRAGRRPHAVARPVDRSPVTGAIVADLSDRLRSLGLDAAFLEGLRAAGPISERRGGAWLVHDGTGYGPRVLPDREYARWRRDQPDLVEVEPSPGCTKVSRLSMGRPDSLRTGLPALEMLVEGGVTAARAWFIGGRPSTESEVTEARADASPAPAFAVP